MKKIMTIAMVAGLMAGVSQAALQANWAAPGVLTLNDNPDDQLDIGSTATDILSLQYSHQNGGLGLGHYFLMTIASAPSGSNFAHSYMINFDLDGSTATGGKSSLSFYVASGLVGIDMIIDSHYDYSSGHSVQHQHDFVGGSSPQFDQQALASYGGSFNSDLALPVGGTQLEWFVPDALLSLGAGTAIYGSTLNAAGIGGDTFDTTGPLAVPEPTSMALLALGMVALGLRRKVSK